MRVSKRNRIDRHAFVIGRRTALERYAACLATFGNIGGIVGPQIYGGIAGSMPEIDGEPDYRYAHAVMVGVALIAAMLMATIASRVAGRAYPIPGSKPRGRWVPVGAGAAGSAGAGSGAPRAALRIARPPLSAVTATASSGSGAHGTEKTPLLAAARHSARSPFDDPLLSGDDSDEVLM